MIARILVLLLLATAACDAAEEMHPFSVHDMLAMQRISEGSASPDGSWIAFTLRSTDLKNNRGRSDLWLVSSDGKSARRLTTHPASDSSPKWTPDGRAVLFLSDRSGSSQIWRIPADGGEAEAVTRMPLDVSNLVLSPSGKLAAFTMEVFPGTALKQTVERDEKQQSRKDTGMIYDRVFIRHWDTWKDGKRSHVFVLPTAGDGTPVDVMKDMDADCPSKPFGGSDEFRFTPDETGLVFTARDVGRTEPWSTDFDLYLSPVNGTAAPQCLTTDNKAWDCCPEFSPDGKIMAYLAMKRPGYESDRFRIVLRSWPAGHERVLTESWDRSPSGVCWSSDGGTIFTTAANLGQRSLFAVDLSSGKARVVVRDGSVSSPFLAGDRIVYSINHLKSPAELYSATKEGQDVRAVTNINSHRVARARMGDFEQFTFAGHNNETVHGYVVKPIGFDSRRKYPVAFLIHGGPQGSFGNTFHYRWNPQAYAGAGYAAVMIDFHGSVGYGQDFTDSIRGDWGGKPLEDLQRGLQAALQRYSWLDEQRVGALGASFGGYMINWIAGVWPDRFRCLVNHDGNLDERMAYYDTEELWFPEWDHEGTPWDNPEGYEKHNPVNHVANWETPMLVIHGARDYRVVDTQGIATFNALQRKGIPSRLLYFPDENHWVLQPHNSILWHETVIDWLDKWVK